MNNITPNLPIPKCNDCGEKLILVEEVTYSIGNNISPITRNKYKCSNSSCQEESDKRAAQKLKIKQEQDSARERRKQNQALRVSTPIKTA